MLQCFLFRIYNDIIWGTFIDTQGHFILAAIVFLFPYYKRFFGGHGNSKEISNFQTADAYFSIIYFLGNMVEDVIYNYVAKFQA